MPNHFTGVNPWFNRGSAVEKPKGQSGTTSNQLSVISNHKSIIVSRPNAIREHSGRYLADLFSDCGRVELRAIGGNNNRFRWFDDPVDLWDQARAWAGDGVALYTTISEPCEDAPRNRGLRDVGVARYRRLLFDFDPERAPGTNATDEQVLAAINMRDDFVQRMQAMGWPEPVLAMSGNGAHAVYRVDMGAERKPDLRGFYRGLATRLRGDGVAFDVTTFNPARVCRLYGTLNRKGNNNHRQSFCEVPPDYRVVPDRALQVAMDTYRIEKPKLVIREPRPVTGGRADYRRLDVVAWFQACGLYRFDMGGGRHSVICPWAGTEHDISCDTDCLVWESSQSGFPQFFCHHAHCSGRWMLDAIKHLGNADQFCGVSV